MLFQELPPEIINSIASFVLHDDLAELAQTCQKCYWSILPHLWHSLTIHAIEEIEMIAQRLYTNDMWRQKAAQYVHNLIICGQRHSRKCSSSFMARIFGIAIPEENKSKHATTHEQTIRQSSIADFGHLVLTLFPHMNHITFDFSQAFKCFQSNIWEEHNPLAFSGAIFIRDYIVDNASFLYIMLSYFSNMQQLTIKSTPVLSLCENLDELLLTNQDIASIASSNLESLVYLQLSYIDWSDIQMQTWTKLIKTLPNLTSFDISWLFAPSPKTYSAVCDILKELAALVPISNEDIDNCKHVRFVPLAT